MSVIICEEITYGKAGKHLFPMEGLIQMLGSIVKNHFKNSLIPAAQVVLRAYPGVSKRPPGRRFLTEMFVKFGT